MTTLSKNQTFCQYFNAWQVQKGERISIVYGKRKIRVRVGDWVCTDGGGHTFAVAHEYFTKYYQLVAV